MDSLRIGSANDVEEEVITRSVVRALDDDIEHRLALIRGGTPGAAPARGANRRGERNQGSRIVPQGRVRVLSICIAEN